ncbi:hypothetical protein HPB49_020690 [Dermacentor silvarum]|uniref:Uncharacterized protein n=1 Tax=Dermacentor silvarum TaxID=543639 RepID=A0ACB8E2Z8_DERSI|nr:hypothetical protein HPB49_020690 [Dermacentor silvarum]
MKPSLVELFAFHTLKQKPNEGERRCDVARNAREAATSKPYMKGELLTTPRTTSSSDSSKPSDRKQYEASASGAVENQTSFIEEEQVIVREKPEPKALTESNMVDIVKQLREFLQDNGPSQEDDLLKALSPSKAQQIIEVYGTLTAFLDRHPGFRVLHEHLYSFVYYQHPEDDECDRSFLVHDGASTGSFLASTSDSGRQYKVACDDESRSARASSSSSSYYSDDSSYGDDKQEKRQMKNGWTQVPSLPRWESRALQAVPETCNAEAQTHGWDLTRFTEMESKVKTSDAKIAELNDRLRTLQESHAREAQQLHAKIDELLEGTAQAPLPNAVEVTNNRPAMNQQRPTDTNGVRAQVIPQAPRPPLRQRYPPPRPKSQLKPHALPIGAKPRPVPRTLPQPVPQPVPRPVPRPVPPVDDKTFIKSAKRPPMPKFHEFPGRKEQVAATCSDIESMQSSPEGSSTKSKAEYQISKIVQMVKKEQPDYSDDEIRRRLDQLRRSLGGFSKMTLNTIAALMIGRLKHEPPKKH